MKGILLLSTGGTIASRPGERGLAPDIGADSLAAYLRAAYPALRFEQREVLNLDSSNIQPEEWRLIAREAHRGAAEFDGVLITHGTDTMAYTASALGFMLQNLGCAVVLTGSQLPIENPLSDAQTNLYTAIAAIEAGMRGVLVAFNRKIINGVRAVKVSTMGFDAFESVNADLMGRVYADGMRINRIATAPRDPARPAELRDELCTDVFLLKLLPGTKPEIFDALGSLSYRGVVVEAFGAGGMHYVQRDLLYKLRELADAGVAVVVCSQCLYERSDLNIYEVGRRMLEQGVISGLDMTTEAAATKLMWALGQAERSPGKTVADWFAENLCGEITLPGA